MFAPPVLRTCAPPFAWSTRYPGLGGSSFFIVRAGEGGIGNRDNALGSTMSGFVRVGDGGVRGFVKRVSACCVGWVGRFGVAISLLQMLG